MKTQITNKVEKIINLVEQLEESGAELSASVNRYNDEKGIDWDIYDLYIDAEADFIRALSNIKDAVIQLMIFENKPF